MSSHVNLKVNLTTIELDPDMKMFATKWFGFEESPTNQVIIEDGIVFIREAAKKGGFVSRN